LIKVNYHFTGTFVAGSERRKFLKNGIVAS